MLKINKSILIICLVLLFLIIGQISASDTDSIEINDTDMNDLILNQATNEISDDSNIKFPKSNLVDKIDDEIVDGIDCREDINKLEKAINRRKDALKEPSLVGT